MSNLSQLSKKERRAIHNYLIRDWSYFKFPPKYKFYLIDKLELIKAQSILINFGYSLSYNEFEDPIEFILPEHEGPFNIITYNYSKVLSVTCDLTSDSNTENIELKDFITNNIISNINLTTHIDQEGYRWRYLLTSENWQCFINNRWLEIDLEKHLILHPLY